MTGSNHDQGVEMEDDGMVGGTAIVISAERPPFPSAEKLSKVRHSEDSELVSKVWRVKMSDLPRNIRAALKLSPDPDNRLSPGARYHYKTGKKYEVKGVAYFLDEPPSVNPRRVGVYYEALEARPRFWFRPLLGKEGGFLHPVNNHDRFFQTRKEYKKWSSR